jgi:hypothetical protein
MLIDLHCHSKYSTDSKSEPEELIERAIELGIDGLCFTEHDSYEASEPIGRIKAPEGFAILRGAEVTTDHGHILVYGANEDFWKEHLERGIVKLDRLLELAHEHGAVLAPAHPLRSSYTSIGAKVREFSGFSAIETHFKGASVFQLMMALETRKLMGLPSIGGSDCHRPDQMGTFATEFDCRIGDMNDLIVRIKNGHSKGVQLKG